MSDDIVDLLDARVHVVLRGPAPGEPVVSPQDTDLAWRRLAGRTVDVHAGRDAASRWVEPMHASAAGVVHTTRHAGQGTRPGATASRWPGVGVHRWVPRAIVAAGLAITASWLGVTRAGNVIPASATTVMTYATPVGRRAVVTLRDGSRVTLAPKTTLRVATDFGATTRAVTLSGEAYFEVAAGSHAPFLVHTGAVTTRVLGTTFDVRRYPEDSAARVAVVAGKVAVDSRARPAVVILTAGAAARVTDSTTTATVGAELPAAWTRGLLVFNDAPVPDVLAALTRWYGYRFRLTDSTLARKNLTVWISTESSQAALSTLKLALDVDLAFDGDAVTMSPRRAGRVIHPTPRDAQDLFSPRTREIGR